LQGLHTCADSSPPRSRSTATCTLYMKCVWKENNLRLRLTPNDRRFQKNGFRRMASACVIDTVQRQNLVGLEDNILIVVHTQAVLLLATLAFHIIRIVPLGD